MFEFLDGKNHEDYIERVEPSSIVKLFFFKRIFLINLLFLGRKKTSKRILSIDKREINKLKNKFINKRFFILF